MGSPIWRFVLNLWVNSTRMSGLTPGFPATVATGQLVVDRVSGCRASVCGVNGHGLGQSGRNGRVVVS